MLREVAVVSVESVIVIIVIVAVIRAGLIEQSRMLFLVASDLAEMSEE